MINAKDFRPTKEIKAAYDAYLSAKENHQYIESRVACIELELLLDGTYLSDEGEPVKEREGIYDLTDAELERFCKDKHVKICEVREEGFDVEEGFCPALIAKNNLRKAANRLMDAAEYITGLTADDLNARIAIKDKYVRTLCDLLEAQPAK